MVQEDGYEVGRLLADSLQRGRLLEGGPLRPLKFAPHYGDEMGMATIQHATPESRAERVHSAAYWVDIPVRRGTVAISRDGEWLQ